jgi:hypothetical protein
VEQQAAEEEEDGEMEEEGAVLRRLIFLQNQTFVQTEVRLLLSSASRGGASDHKNKSSKKKKKKSNNKKKNKKKKDKVKVAFTGPASTRLSLCLGLPRGWIGWWGAAEVEPFDALDAKQRAVRDMAAHGGLSLLVLDADSKDPGLGISAPPLSFTSTP